MKKLLTVLLCIAGMSLTTPARAEFPDKPLRLLVPLPAGGPSDTAARSLARALSGQLGQPVTVENHPGANGVVGVRALQAAAPDGYTLLFAPSSMTGLPALLKSPPYASMLEFTPVSTVGGNHLCMYVHPSVPARSVAAFAEHARAHPGQLSFGTSTPLEFMTAAQLMKESGVRMVRVPYKGGAQMLPDLIEGRIQVGFTPPGVGMAHAQAGRIRTLACTAPARLQNLPDVPTMAEAGFAAVHWPAYHLILAPPNAPPNAVALLAKAIRIAMDDPSLRADYARLQITTDALEPAAMAGLIRDGERLWRQFVQDVDYQPD